MSVAAASGNATCIEFYQQANSCSETITLAQSVRHLIAPFFLPSHLPSVFTLPATGRINACARPLKRVARETLRDSGLYSSKGSILCQP